jgi:hypothetical protein
MMPEQRQSSLIIATTERDRKPQLGKAQDANKIIGFFAVGVKKHCLNF